MANKIMLIDDDYSTNYYHKIILEDVGLGEELIICNSVDLALTQLLTLEPPPKIICLDINMPMKNGWDFLKEYQELPDKYKADRIVMLSTTHLPSDIDRISEHKLIHDFWIKPLDPVKLKELIEEK